MPSQHSFCHAACACKRKNAFEISGPVGLDHLFRVFFFVLVASVDHFEKVSRRKLFVIADHDYLVGPRDNSKCILGRNLTLLSKAAVFCARHAIGEIAMAPLESNPFPDARPEFFRAFARAVEIGVGLKLKVRTPFAGLTKADVVKRGAGMPLALTVSCARPTKGNLHCGACTKCAERVEGFAAAGVPDPTPYARRPGK